MNNSSGKCLRAVVQCVSCGHLTKGDPVPIPGNEVIDAGVTEKFLCAAVGGLMRTRESDLRCSACGEKILQAGTKLFLMFDAGKETIH